MQRQHQQSFNELNEAGVFDDLFAEVVDDISGQWQKAETVEAREELWHRQRVVRDVRRAFKSAGGIDAAE